MDCYFRVLNNRTATTTATATTTNIIISRWKDVRRYEGEEFEGVDGESVGEEPVKGLP
jgi:hypothetical protein